MRADLKSFSDEQLLLSTATTVKDERLKTADVIRHFQEIYDRRLHLEMGFATLFDMVTRHYGYCAPSAQRRINAMRLIQDLPVVEQKLESNELTLTAAAGIQSFLQAEAKASKTYSQAEKLELVEACLSKSTREIERELARRIPEILQKESMRAVGDARFNLNFSISTELESDIRRLKGLLSHSHPNMKFEELLKYLVGLGLEKHDPVRKAKRAEKRKLKRSELPLKPFEEKSLPAPEMKSRYIPAQVQRQVRHAYNDGCSFIDLKTGRRCGSKYLIQIDHIKPYSHGGKHESQNLRLLCAQHNRWRWENRKVMGATVKPVL